jgi:hypothetical protein
VGELGEGLIVLILRREQKNPAKEREKAKPKFTKIGIIPLPFSSLTTIKINLFIHKITNITYLHHYHPSQTKEKII